MHGSYIHLLIYHKYKSTKFMWVNHTNAMDPTGIVLKKLNYYCKFCRETVDVRNPAPVDMVNILLFTRFYTSQVAFLPGFLNHQHNIIQIQIPGLQILQSGKHLMLLPTVVGKHLGEAAHLYSTNFPDPRHPVIFIRE